MPLRCACRTGEDRFPMNDRSLRPYLLASIALTLAPSGCGVLLGLDDFKESGGTGTSGVGGAGGTGGVASSSSGTETATTASSASGTGGAMSTTSAGTGGMSSSSSGTGGDASSSSTSGGCIAGTTMSCYSGLPSTLGVGKCMAGTATCQVNGMYGPCFGEKLPVAEDCKALGDENCDGISCSETVWAKVFGDASDQHPVSVAVNGSGDIVVAGYFLGSLVLGGTSLISAGSSDFFVTKLSSKGTVLWAKQYGDAIDNGNEIAVTFGLAGQVAVTGGFKGAIKFGATTLTSAGGEDVFAAMLDASGTPIWAKKFGDAANQRARSVAATAQGDIILAGGFFGTVDFGGGLLTSAGSQDIFLTKLSGTTGASIWAKRLGDAGGQPVAFQNGTAVTVDPVGNVLLTGTFTTSIALGGMSPLLSVGADDIFLAKFDSAGAYSWGQGFGSTGSDFSGAIATDSTGNIAITGSGAGAISFGGASLVPNGASGTVVAKFDTTGAHQWSKIFGDAQLNLGLGIAIDSAGEVAFAGFTYGNMNFGGGILPNSGGGGSADIFLAKLDAAGAYRWGKLFGDFGQQSVTGLAVDLASNDLVLIGTVQSTTVFGSSTLTAVGGDDFAIAKFQP